MILISWRIICSEMRQIVSRQFAVNKLLLKQPYAIRGLVSLSMIYESIVSRKTNNNRINTINPEYLRLSRICKHPATCNPVDLSMQAEQQDNFLLPYNA